MYASALATELELELVHSSELELELVHSSSLRMLPLLVSRVVSKIPMSTLQARRSVVVVD